MTTTHNSSDSSGPRINSTTQTAEADSAVGPTEPTRRPGRQVSRAKVPRSRMGGAWVALVVAAFVLLLLLVFILQNGQAAQVSFFGAHGTLPMGVALLLAAIFGVMLVALPGTARIIQLRILSRRSGGDAARSAPGPAAEHPATPNDATGTQR